MPTEEERAAAYRLQQAARRRNKLRAERALKGDPAALRALQEPYRPLMTGQAIPRVGER
jgi:hypothetical protein